MVRRRTIAGKEQRQSWLAKFERGDTAATIAEKEMVDVRTVRAQIEVARTEKLADDVQRDLLKDALKEHHEELLKYLGRAKELLLDWKQRDMLLEEQKQPIATVLKEHIPYSSVWDNLDNLRVVSNRYDDLGKEVRENVEKGAKEIGLKFVKDIKDRGLVDAVGDTVMEDLCYQAQGVEVVFTRQKMGKGWGRGKDKRTEDTTRLGRNLKSKSSEPGGGLAVGYVTPGKEKELEEMYLKLRDKAFTKEKMKELKRVIDEKDELQKLLREEIEILTLRKMLPGHCRACPI